MKADAINSFVIDASVAVSWCLEDEKAFYTEWLLDRMAQGAQAVVPAHWVFEVANALMACERRKRLTASQSMSFLEQLGYFYFEVDAVSVTKIFDRVCAQARQSGLSVYDAAYLELASRRGLPFATLDGPLKKAAKEIGVPIIHLPQ